MKQLLDLLQYTVETFCKLGYINKEAAMLILEIVEELRNKVETI